MTKLKNVFSLEGCDQKEKIKYILMYIAIALLVIINIIMGMTFAKYVASGAPTGDSARVADFDVSITAQNDDALTDGSLEIDFGNSDIPYATYDFKVANNSEVAVEYALILTMNAEYDSNIFEITAVAADGTEIAHSAPAKVSGTTKYRYTFPDVGQLSMGGQANGQIKFALKDGEDTGYSTTLSDMNLEIVVSQID